MLSTARDHIRLTAVASALLAVGLSSNQYPVLPMLLARTISHCVAASTLRTRVGQHNFSPLLHAFSHSPLLHAPPSRMRPLGCIHPLSAPLPGGVRVTGFVHGSALFRSQPRPLSQYSAVIERGAPSKPHPLHSISTQPASSPHLTALLRLSGVGSTYDGMMHVVDWLDTICDPALANCNRSSMNKTLVSVERAYQHHPHHPTHLCCALQARDGVNQWSALSTGGGSPRSRLVLDLGKPGGKWKSMGGGAGTMSMMCSMPGGKWKSIWEVGQVR
jgi:hypothetical protein